MSEPFNNIPQGNFSLADVELIAQAKMLEQTPALNWESADANRATRQASLAVGEGATVAAFLSARARIVKKLIEAKNPSIKSQSVHLMPPMWLTWLLFAMALIAGLMTDQLAGTASHINLLSVPFFGVLAWNLLVYLMLFISGLRKGQARDFLGIRAGFSFLQKGVLAKSLGKARTLGPLMMPLLNQYSARAFHMAALAFVIGMILSVLLRGVGTAYTVGWESTWFAESPETVYQIIMLTYGFFTNFLGQMPSVLEVANLRFDRLAISGAQASAGLWLLRMVVMLAIFIVVPRLLLVLKHSVAIGKLKRHFPMDLNDGYYETILKVWRAEEMNLDLVMPANSPNPKALETIYRYAESLGFNLSEVRTHTMDFELEDTPMTLQTNGSEQQIWIMLSGTTTPEHEVQGRAVESIRANMGKAPVVLMVDMADYITRFGAYNERIETRRQLFEDFAASCAVPVIFYEAGTQPDTETCEALKRAADRH